MKTDEALTRFLDKCIERGLSAETRRQYLSYLRRFAEEYPTLPTDTRTIDLYLKQRKETPGRRGEHFKRLQAFYSYLEEYEGATSPVPPKGQVGRPRKASATNGTAADPQTLLDYQATLDKNKLVIQGPAASISTSEAVASLIKSRMVEGVSARTIENYGYYFKAFIRKFPILPLTVEPIEDFLGSIKGTPETRWSYRRNLITLYHFLEKRKLIPKELFEFPKIKVPRKVRRVLSEEELRTLFPFAGSFQEKTILALLIDSKVRASELTSLTRENTFPDHIIVDAKGGGQRQIPISPQTYGTLIQLASKGYLFTVNGRPMKREYLRLMIRRLMERAGLEGVKLGPHILRHSASVQHMMAGGDLLSLKEELGHTTTKMTEVYGRLAFPQVKEKHQQIDVLGKVAGQSFVERAKCYGCQHEIVLELALVKATECPQCHQVGKWYLPDAQGQGVLA